MRAINRVTIVSPMRRERKRGRGGEKLKRHTEMRIAIGCLDDVENTVLAADEVIFIETSSAFAAFWVEDSTQDHTRHAKAHNTQATDTNKLLCM